jgi:hypothetical protein
VELTIKDSHIEHFQGGTEAKALERFLRELAKAWVRRHTGSQRFTAAYILTRGLAFINTPMRTIVNSSTTTIPGCHFHIGSAATRRILTFCTLQLNCVAQHSAWAILMSTRMAT